MNNQETHTGTQGTEKIQASECDKPTGLEYITPDALKRDDDAHVRSTPGEPSKALRRNIRELGRIIKPVHARRINGDLHVFDGWRRVLACRQLGFDVATFIYEDLDRGEAMIKSLKLNDKQAGMRKSVTDNDREKSMMGLATGERRTVNSWEDANDELAQERYRLGLDSEEDKLRQKIGGVTGVGSSTLASLIQTFGNTESVLQATHEELQTATGVGPATAKRIREHVNRDGAELITNVN